MLKVRKARNILGWICLPCLQNSFHIAVQPWAELQSAPKVNINGISKRLDQRLSGLYSFSPAYRYRCKKISGEAEVQVDVWSAAVMHFQMLFGKRPFGEGLTQERILREDVMLNARKVTFPTKPAVSQECKDFLTRWICLHSLSHQKLQATILALLFWSQPTSYSKVRPSRHQFL